MKRQFLYVLIPENLSASEGSFRANLARLVDKAIAEYSEAREHILAEIDEPKRPVKEMMETGRIIYTVGFINCMENCISATHRALLMLDRLKRLPIGVHMPVNVRKLIESHVQEINDVRDVIEHLDAEIRAGNIKAGEPVMLAPGRDQKSVICGAHALTFDRLATVLSNLHKLGLELYGKQVPSSPSTPPTATSA